MNLLKLTCCLALAVGFIACDKDDDKECTPADWVGTYEGTIECVGAVEENVVVTITASGTNNIIIQYETATITVEYDPLPPNSCNLDFSDSAGGISLTIDADLDGDHLTLEEVYSDGSVTANCVIHASK